MLRAEAARRERVDEFRRGLPGRFDRAPLERAEQKLITAVGAYLDEARSLDAAMDDAADEARSLEPLPAGPAVDSPRFGLITDGTAPTGGPARRARSPASSSLPSRRGGRGR